MQADTKDADPQPTRPRFRPCPWIEMQSPAEVEGWIEEHNRSLQEHIRPNETGYGVCFTLSEGGEIFLHTSSDGAIVLDVTEEAQWVAPLISAATRTEAPHTSLWVLPDDKLIQLIFGLNSLIASTILVVNHDFGRKKRLAYQSR